MHDPWWWRAILTGVGMFGLWLGWTIVDHWIEARKAKREAQMRDITPK